MILVTGGAGYIGSHAVISLLEDDVEVLIFDNLETGHIETVNALKKVSSLVNFVKGDLKNFNEINQVFQNYNIDSVMHFAASSIVSESVSNPEKYYRNNVLGSMNLFKAMVENEVKKIVFSSTCAVYGEPEYMPMDELHPKNPINPYGQSKLMIEKILEDFDSAYGLKSVMLRYFNVVGADKLLRAGEWHATETHLIPNVLKSTFKTADKFKIFGDDYDTADGTCVRDYINVEDLISAHKLALDYINKTKQSNVFNLGTNDGNSVREVFELCEKVVDKKINYEIVGRRDGDLSRLSSDNTKVNQILGWQAKTPLEKSIKTAYEWEKLLQARIN